MISKELSETLGFAVKEAKKRRHEYVSVEHVLFALLHDETGMDIIEKCNSCVYLEPKLKAGLCPLAGHWLLSVGQYLIMAVINHKTCYNLNWSKIKIFVHYHAFSCALGHTVNSVQEIIINLAF